MHVPFRRVLCATALAPLAWLTPASVAGAQATFHFDDPSGGNLVEFQSKASVESFQGRTSRLTGSVVLDPADVSTMTGQLVVDVASFDTGIGLRNTHMREQVLHCDKYPQATLVITAVKPEGASTLRHGESMTAKLTGDLTLHGVTHPVTADVVATWWQGPADGARGGADDRLEVQARFAVKLSEFGMERPKMLVMKVSDEIKLRVRATATTASRTGQLAAPGN